MRRALLIAVTAQLAACGVETWPDDSPPEPPDVVVVDTAGGVVPDRVPTTVRTTRWANLRLLQMITYDSGDILEEPVSPVRYPERVLDVVVIAAANSTDPPPCFATQNDDTERSDWICLSVMGPPDAGPADAGP